MLPDSISDMTRLKALLLENCKRLEKVPYLGKMKALRELNLSGTAIKEAPQGLEELLNLRFLSMYAYGLEMLPRGVLLKFKYLHHLDLPIDIQVETEEIKSMKKLEEFGGGVRNASDFNRFFTTCGVQHDPYYKIGVNLKDIYGSIFGLRGDFGSHNNNMLVLCESKLKDEKVLGKGVVDLRIWRCEGLSKWFQDDLWERFDNPTSLKKLEIIRCGGIEWIMRSGDGQGSQLSSTLEEIELRELDDLNGVVAVGREEIHIPIGAASIVFSSLKGPNIFKCNKMRKLGLQVSRVPNLERISIIQCGEIQEIFEDEDEDEEGSAASTLPKLRVLTLVNLPRLKRISKATIISNSIRTISIEMCPELMNKLPLHFDDPAPPPSPIRIKVGREWWESLEWDDPELLLLLNPSFI